MPLMIWAALGAWRFIRLAGVFFGARRQRRKTEIARRSQADAGRQAGGNARHDGSRLADKAARSRRRSGFAYRTQDQDCTGSGNHGKVKAACRRHGNAPNDPLFRRIVTFDCSMSDGRQFGLMTMDFQSRAFEAPAEAAPVGTPLRCPRPMSPNPSRPGPRPHRPLPPCDGPGLAARPTVPAISRRRA